MALRSFVEVNDLKILSCGAGMQSTALALMSCEMYRQSTRDSPLPIPRYRFTIL